MPEVFGHYIVQYVEYMRSILLTCAVLYGLREDTAPSNTTFYWYFVSKLLLIVVSHVETLVIEIGKMIYELCCCHSITAGEHHSVLAMPISHDIVDLVLLGISHQNSHISFGWD